MQDADRMNSGVDISSMLPPKGVWLVWNSYTKESLNAIFPQDQEIEALRKVNEQGYGYAEFTEWGEV